MPGYFDEIYGNRALKEYFTDRINNRDLSHAFILEGGCGSGKKTLARLIARGMMCMSGDNGACGVCKNCRQVSEGTSPDVELISLPVDKATISVEIIREIRNKAQSVPIEGDYKFFIISDSDKMTVQAQNALLKILEEPPGFVVFILLSENSGLLLPTIRSRAPVFKLQRFNDDELAKYFLSNDKNAAKLCEKDENKFMQVMRASLGYIGIAAYNLGKKNVDHISRIHDEINTMFELLISADKSRFMACEDFLPGKREELREYLSEIRLAMRDILFVKRGGRTDCMFFTDDEFVSKVTKKLTISSVLSLLDANHSALTANDMNANINAIRINFMCDIWKCVHKG